MPVLAWGSGGRKFAPAARPKCTCARNYTVVRSTVPVPEMVYAPVPAGRNALSPLCSVTVFAAQETVSSPSHAVHSSEWKLVSSAFCATVPWMSSSCTVK